MISTTIHRFPHDPVLVQLLAIAHQTPPAETVIEDDALGCQKTYPEFLADIVATRELLRAQLPPSALDTQGLLCEKRQNMVVLAKSSYEFLVAFFAIRSLEGEADYLLSMTSSISILAGRGSMERASNIRTYMEQTKSESLTVVPVSSDAKPLGGTGRAIETDHGCIMAPDGSGLIMLTSGTTGRPKGAVLPRCSIIGTGVREPGSVALVYRPNHWMGGVRDVIQSLLSGRRVYSLKAKLRDARAEDVLRAFRTTLITHVAFMPDVLRRMMLLLTRGRDQSDIPQEERDLWHGYFRGLSMLRCSGGFLERSVRDFWIGLMGLPFDNFYSSTELGGLAIGGPSQIYGSMGTPIPGIKVKLSEGDRGEVCVKSPKMLLRYIGNKHTIESIFDKEGYYKTGDLAKYINGEYIFAGRVATDCIQYTIFQFSTLAVEDGLTSLPYISEACVVAVPHTKFRQLCGAVVRLRPDSQIPNNMTTLGLIRSDLEGSLPAYMMPTLLKVLKHEEELPCTVAGKPKKKEILSIYFGSVNGAQVENYPPEIETCHVLQPGEAEATKPWDWDARQFEQ
ncbi:hypothetical protein TESG_03369 [Trichophyton tonsurans CBS 112818]|uniref:AMP-dependent synthetase/ligase domain-containing protein n=1 Tax=Trichophyton tonsurans (strain CBS 112818) TaxID=647933 RepID=F2RXC2_TRIT1|nr:hypothetical protein TESG_03369 [Trichophyton tonsurans CBS 112818]